MDRSFKTFGQTGILMATPEIRVLALDMGQHLPEKGLSHIRVSNPVGMRQAVSAGRSGTANRGQNSRVITESVSHVIERKTVRELNMQHSHNV